MFSNLASTGCISPLGTAGGQAAKRREEAQRLHEDGHNRYECVVLRHCVLSVFCLRHVRAQRVALRGFVQFGGLAAGGFSVRGERSCPAFLLASAVIRFSARARFNPFFLCVACEWSTLSPRRSHAVYTQHQDDVTLLALPWVFQFAKTVKCLRLGIRVPVAKQCADVAWVCHMRPFPCHSCEQQHSLQACLTAMSIHCSLHGGIGTEIELELGLEAKLVVEERS